MGYRIREIREDRGMTQVELAEKSGVSRTTIYGLETGAEKITTTKTLNKLAHALGVSIDEIFFDKGV